MRRPQLVSRGSLNRMMQAAAEAEAQRDFKQCIEILERASRLDPANSDLLLSLGGVYGKCYDYAAAGRCFEKAIRVAPKKGEALAVMGRKCHDFGREEMAGDFLRRAAEQKDASPEILVQLAELYERLRRVDDAQALIDRALQANGACSPALLVRARLERQAGRLDSAEQLLRSLPSSADR